MSTGDRTIDERLLRRMELVRAFEERVIELYHHGDIAGLVHVGIGQEAVAVGVAEALEERDYLYTGHRPHGHFLARGADPDRLMAELAGRASGYCKGLGGSMHVVAADVHAMTATGIVGGAIPLALGTALACREEDAVVAVLFGDGAANTGGFHESLNIASLWKLPVVLVCENNGYAEFSPMSEHTLVDRVSAHAAPYAMPSVVVDGNDVMAVRNAMSEAVWRARTDEGPTIVECLTYRLGGHYVGDPAKYREASEVAEWRKKDPIRVFASKLRRHGEFTEADLDIVRAEAQARVEQAVRFALASPLLSMEDVTASVYG